ncbi:MAG: hypothetical protein ABSE62_05735 [Chthoniobacteraceae bacterium]|jgi:hypothetical protein
MSDRQKLFYAFLASAFLHIAICAILGLWGAEHASEVAKALPDLSQLTVTIMQPTAAPEIVTPPAPPAHPRLNARPVLDSDGLTPSAKAPTKAVFQSDSNMVAGSRLPATGNMPMPTEAGPARNFMDFEDRPHSFGKGETPAPLSPARPAAPASLAMPVQTPSAITQVQNLARAQAAQTPVPKPTAAPNTLALGTPTPTPSARPTPSAELARLTIPPALRADLPSMTRPASPPSAGLPEPAMQRETTRTRIDGGITAPGPDGVDAVETPFGRYHRKLSTLIGSRWQLYLQEHPKNIGDVTILVMLNTDGKVAATRVIANNAVDDLAELSTRAILESDLPPVPDDLAPMLRDGRLEITFNFNVYDPNNDPSGR